MKQNPQEVVKVPLLKVGNSFDLRDFKSFTAEPGGTCRAPHGAAATHSPTTKCLPAKSHAAINHLQSY